MTLTISIFLKKGLKIEQKFKLFFKNVRYHHTQVHEAHNWFIWHTDAAAQGKKVQRALTYAPHPDWKFAVKEKQLDSRQ